MENTIEVQGIRISWSGALINRWQKYGNDRLYLAKSKAYVDLQKPEDEIEQEFPYNPYGWHSNRIIKDGRQIGVRHEYRDSFVEIVRI